MTTQTEALRLALEALEHEAEIGNDDAYRKEREAIKEALAQPEQEPVAFICEFYADEGHPFVSFEPVTHGTNTPLYSTPPPVPPAHKRTWVNATTWRGLTDEDKKEYVSQDFGGNRLDAMDWAEKRLKERNTK